MRWFTVVLLGLALGVGASAADVHVGAGPDQRDWVRVTMILLNTAAAWVAVAYLAGRTVRSWRQVLTAGPVALWLAVLGYYVYGAVFGDRSDVGWSGLTGVARFWLVAAAVAGPVFGVLGYVARRHDLVGLVAGVAVPVTALLEVFGRLRLSAAGFDVDPLREWTVAALAGAAATAVAWSVIGFTRHDRNPEQARRGRFARDETLV